MTKHRYNAQVRGTIGNGISGKILWISKVPPHYFGKVDGIVFIIVVKGF